MKASGGNVVSFLPEAFSNGWCGETKKCPIRLKSLRRKAEARAKWDTSELSCVDKKDADNQKPTRSPAQRVRVGKEEQRSGTQFQGGPQRDRLETEWSGFRSDVEQGTGVEPACSAWEADALPMY